MINGLRLGRQLTDRTCCLERGKQHRSWHLCWLINNTVSVTLRQTAVAPGRFPLLLRTYELSNGCARPLAFYRPDAQFPLFEFQTSFSLFS